MRVAPLKIERCLGIDNVNRPERADKARYQELLDVDVTDSGSIHRRMGGTDIYSGAAHSLGTNGSDLLFVDGTNLVRLEANNTTTTLRSDLRSGDRMRYLALNDALYYSNGTDSGVYQNGASRSWGLPIPPRPTLTATVGDLLVGKYLVSLTYMRDDGQESGASAPVMVDVTAGGFSVANVVASTDAGVDHICVYISSADGEILWRQAKMPNDSALFTVAGGLLASGVELRTANMAAPPTCTKMVFYRGRIYMVSGGTLWHTEPWNYELVSFDRNFIFLDGPIAMLEAVENGLWVGTKKETMFLSGSDPLADGGFQIRSRQRTGAIDGAHTTVDSFVLGRDGVAPGRVAIWAGSEGIFAGDSNGLLIDLTSKFFVPPDVDEGWACYEKTADASRVLFGFKTGAGYGSGDVITTTT